MPVAAATTTSSPTHHSISSSSTSTTTQTPQEENKPRWEKGSVLAGLTELKTADSETLKKYANANTNHSNKILTKEEAQANYKNGLANALTADQAQMIGLDSNNPGHFDFNKFDPDKLDKKTLEAVDDMALQTAIALSVMTENMPQKDLEENYSALLKEAEDKAKKVANQRCLDDLISNAKRQGFIVKNFENTSSNDPLAEAIIASVIKNDLPDREAAAKAYQEDLKKLYEERFPKENNKVPDIQELSNLINTVSARSKHQPNVKHQKVNVHRADINDGKLEQLVSNNHSENLIYLLHKGRNDWSAFIPSSTQN